MNHVTLEDADDAATLLTVASLSGTLPHVGFREQSMPVSSLAAALGVAALVGTASGEDTRLLFVVFESDRMRFRANSRVK